MARTCFLESSPSGCPACVLGGGLGLPQGSDTAPGLPGPRGDVLCVSDRRLAALILASQPPWGTRPALPALEPHREGCGGRGGRWLGSHGGGGTWWKCGGDTHTQRVLGTSSHSPDGGLSRSFNVGYGDARFFVRSCSVFDNNRQDPTGLTAALQATDLAGVLHMLYCVLFHGTLSDPSTASPKDSFPQSTVQVATQSLRFLNSFAALDLPAFQVPGVRPRQCSPAG